MLHIFRKIFRFTRFFYKLRHIKTAINGKLLMYLDTISMSMQISSSANIHTDIKLDSISCRKSPRQRIMFFSQVENLAYNPIHVFNFHLINKTLDISQRQIGGFINQSGHYFMLNTSKRMG